MVEYKHKINVILKTINQLLHYDACCKKNVFLTDSYWQMCRYTCINSYTFPVSTAMSWIPCQIWNNRKCSCFIQEKNLMGFMSILKKNISWIFMNPINYAVSILKNLILRRVHVPLNKWEFYVPRFSFEFCQIVGVLKLRNKKKKLSYNWWDLLCIYIYIYIYIYIIWIYTSIHAF